MQQTRIFNDPFTLLSYIFDLVSFLTSILDLGRGEKPEPGFNAGWYAKWPKM